MSAGRPPEQPRAICAPDPRAQRAGAPDFVAFLWCAALLLALVEVAVHLSTATQP
jgi:hypothetical protein